MPGQDASSPALSWHAQCLVCTGWWGLARHFHYLPEVMAAFFWSLPFGFTAALPYFYVLFLVRHAQTMTTCQCLIRPC